MLRLTNTYYPGTDDEGFDPDDFEHVEARANGRPRHDAEDEESAAAKLLHGLSEHGPAPAGMRTAIAGHPHNIGEEGEVTFVPQNEGRIAAMKVRFQNFISTQKEKKTPALLREIWKSDYSIVAFIPMTVLFYAMKDTGIPFLGVLFFMLAMATVDAILSIFVVRLSFHQNKHGFYRTEDYERDWLRYRVLLTMTKGALFFVIGMSCGWTAIVGAHIVWFFTTCQRLRYVILRWSMDDTYPDLQKWSVFALLREVGVEPRLKAFNMVALIGAILGLGITLIPWGDMF